MEAASTGTLLLVLLLLLVLTLALPRTPGHLPPGPMPLPLLGNLLQLRPGALYLGLLRLSKKYGPVFTVYLGPWRRVVVLVGHEAVQEALGGQAEEFSGRGMLATLDGTFEGHGVFFSNGERWRQLKRFTTLALRDLGMGKREGEELIQAEARCLVEAFQGTEGQPFDPSLLLAQATSNIICSLTFGLRFPYEDEEFQTVVRAAGGAVLGISSPWGQAYEMFSQLLQHLPGPHTQLLGHLSILATFAIQQVQRHKGSPDTSGPACDVVDAFLLKMAEEEQDPNTEWTDKNLLMTVIYLLFAGTVTVSTTVRYALLLLLKYPQVQERVREELTRELGAGRAPGLGDRARLPYTDAVLHEAQRLLALVPMGMPHALTRTTCFRGYTLPQGTEVFPLLGSVLHDPEVFEKPEEFNPERFLDADGRFQKQEAFLPFSLGKRVCLGEGLARAELFLLFTAILQAFSLESPCPPGTLSLQPAFSGLFNIPPAFQLQVRPTDLHPSCGPDDGGSHGRWWPSHGGGREHTCVSRTASPHHRQPRPHTWSCFLGSVADTQPTRPQGHAHSAHAAAETRNPPPPHFTWARKGPRVNSATQAFCSHRFSASGVTTMCPDNTPSRTQHNSP
ncbi:LOW QUALITY PROTEIN: cytochrome P450 2S1 [Panthera pardus]|uniref:Cytochrome P450 n=1 Tax=Panthera pardus TaxID=9691 RepID=A0A9V1EW01_PANPR|nr:LOW QUALITY PROTEIN: cytochrome P450 2S1 [Panthera pardus]